MNSSSTSSFDLLAGSDDDPLFAAAASATAHVVERDDAGVLVIIVRPETDDFHVLSGGGTGVLRAAVSVAVAAGNDRVWRDAPHADTAEYPVTALPEVITASADAAGVHVAHTGCVRRGDTTDAVAIWFETWRGVADAGERRQVLHDLEHAALIAAERREAAAATAAADAAAAPAPTATDTARRWDTDDPEIDPVTGVIARDTFIDGFDEFEGADATMLMVDLDAFRSVAETYGDATSDAVLRLVADRLVDELGPTDRVGRVGHDRFAILLGDVDRSEVMLVAKRILAAVAAPLPGELGPESVTATTALAYQDGLVDLEELFDAAASAVASGKRSGTGKLVLAA